MVTIHGVTMIFFLVMPTIWGGAGNLMQPVTIGSAEVAFPLINNFSLVLLLTSFGFVLMGVTGEWSVGYGWTMYPPMSSRNYTSKYGILCLTLGLVINGTSSTASSQNFIGILMSTKTAGLPSPVYAVAIAVASVLLIASLPFLTGGLVMVSNDCISAFMDIDTHQFFDWERGGDILFYQHLFWLFGHPEVYVLIVPVFAFMTYTLNISTGRDVVGTTGMIGGTGCIGVLGLLVWSHHMYTTGMEADARAYFSAGTFTIAIPTGLKITHWASTICIHHTNTTH